jgi:hypothetical protein
MAEDALLQATCLEVVELVAKAVDTEPERNRSVLKLPNGSEVGWQIMIDASEKKGVLNICRMSIFNADTAPDAEVARIEYEHDKQGKFESRRVYSIQSVRRRARELVLLENFLAVSPETVREQDFRPIGSETYAQTVVLKTVRDWAQFRAWQLQGGHKK